MKGMAKYFKTSVKKGSCFSRSKGVNVTLSQEMQCNAKPLQPRLGPKQVWVQEEYLVPVKFRVFNTPLSLWRRPQRDSGV